MTRDASSARRRVFWVSVAAFVLYGSWAGLMNLSHGIPAALRAGLVQGVSSLTATAFLSSLIEWVFARTRGSRAGAAVAVLVASAGATSLHLTLHLVTGTPEILRAILLPVVMSLVFGASYAAYLLRRGSGN